MAGVYSKKLLLKLEEKLQNNLKIKALIEEENFLFQKKDLEFEKEIKIFSNINTLEELNNQK